MSRSDVEKAFLLVSVKADDRDTLRLFWYETDSNAELKLLQLRFNRLVFGLTPSPAILGGVVQHNLEKYEHTWTISLAVLTQLKMHFSSVKSLRKL